MNSAAGQRRTAPRNLRAAYHAGGDGVAIGIDAGAGDGQGGGRGAGGIVWIRAAQGGAEIHAARAVEVDELGHVGQRIAVRGAQQRNPRMRSGPIGRRISVHVGIPGVIDTANLNDIGGPDIRRRAGREGQQPSGVRATGIDTGGGDDLKVDGLVLARVDPNEDYQYGQIVST